MLTAAARALSLSAFLIALVGAPNATAAVDASFNFQPAGTPTVSGYTPDTGAAFTTASGRGWVRADSLALPSAQHVPLDLTSATRDRNLLADQLKDTLIHMQLPTGTPAEGAWEYVVPNGSYTVTVSVGDQSYIDSRHRIRVEGQPVIAGFTPTTATRFATGTTAVSVTDGRLTVDQTGGGSNTKLNYIQISSIDGEPGARPSVGVVAPEDGSNDVYRDRAVTAEVVLPNVGGGIDPATVTGANVFLKRVSDGALVNANVNTTGGGDAIILQPRGLLDSNTQYRFTVTDGLRDATGASFLPKTTTFTTGTRVKTTSTPVRFDQVPQSAGAGELMASVTVGPDHRLYITTLDGKILRFPIQANGNLSAPTTINTIATHEGGPRHVLGLAFDPASTAAAPILWVSHSAAAYTDGPNWTGKVSRLSGTNLSVIQDYVTQLPRSSRDHETNSLAFGPDGALYINQGSLSAMGAPDNAWGDRPEQMLSAAILRLVPSQVTTPPLNVKTAEGGTYDPFATGAPLTVYASGVRNAFDLVWHSNGQLYAPVNGSAAGGSIPGTPATLPARCAKRIDGAWTGPATPARSGALVQPDILISVKKGKYYGHPNPSRCEYAAFGGNPTSSADPIEESVYPVGTQPDRNWLAPIWNFGEHFSPNGVIEYHGSQWGGALDGALLIVRYSAGDDIVALKVAASDGTISGEADGIPGFSGFTDPLDIAQDPETGNLYVTEYTPGRVTLLRPNDSGTPAVKVTPSIHYEDSVVNETAVNTAAKIESTGSAPLSVTGLQITGPNAADFAATGASALPITVAAGTTSPLRITFKPTSVGIKTATLTVATNAGEKTIELRGLGTAGLGGTLEPSLQRILDLYRIGVDVGDADPASTVLPVGSRLADEVPAQRFKAVGSDPVAIEPLAVFGPTGPNGRVGRIGWVPPTGAANRTDLITVPNAAAQDVAPEVAGPLTFQSGGLTFGFFATFEAFGTQTAYTEDALNTLGSGGSASHQARTFALRDADGKLVPNAYVVAFEDLAPGAGSDYNDVVMVVRGVTPVDVTAARFKTQSLDPGALPDRLTFSRIGASPSAQAATFHQHDEAVVRVQNAGSASAQVNRLTVTGPFQLVSAPTLPATVAAGASLDVRVRFTATSGAVSTGKLEVGTTATATPALGVDLAGYWQSAPEGAGEPSLAQLVSVLGYGTAITDSGDVLNGKGHVEQVGDEVLAPYWKRLDPTKTAQVTQLAAFHPQTSGDAFKFALRGAEKAAARTVGSHDPLDDQSLLPHASSGTTVLTRSFTPPASFAFSIGDEWTDSTLNDATADQAAGCAEPCGHHVRAWPAKDQFGRAIAGSYIVAVDTGRSYAYNDDVYLVENVEPDTARPVLARIDAGATAAYIDAAGNRWAPDTGLFSPSTAPVQGPATDAISATADDKLYASYRGNIGNVAQASRVVTYTIPITGASRADVRLYMAERWNTAAGARVMNVSAENVLRISNLDIFGRAGGKNVAWSEEIRDVDVSDGVLTLRFSATKDHPLISGIEVRCSAGCGG